ncbi:MAG: GAF domain-containing sensor histidine kinase [Chloroflexota bacterium]
MNTVQDNTELRRRLAVLDELNLLSIDETETFDRLTRLATQLLKVPVSQATMVAEDHQVYIGCTGLEEPHATGRQTPLSHSFCKHVVETASPLIINDTRLNPLVSDNPAIEEFGALAYLGIPLITSDGISVGSFCVLDSEPRIWQDNDLEALKELAQSVMTEIELRYELKKRRDVEATLMQYIRQEEQTRIAKEMTVSLSHDLRTPLSTIKLRVDMLKERTQDGDTLSSLDAIGERVDTITSVLNDFLLMWTPSHIPKKAQEIVYIDVILNHALEDVRELRQATINATHLEENLPIQVNRQLMKVAIANILENSIIYNSSEQIVIDIVVEHIIEKIKITITDNGDGIPDDELSHVFEPLYKVNKARSFNASGSGLGLTISQQIIQAHQGTIELLSTVDVGTTVTITLPVAQ